MSLSTVCSPSPVLTAGRRASACIKCDRCPETVRGVMVEAMSEESASSEAVRLVEIEARDRGWRVAFPGWGSVGVKNHRCPACKGKP